MLSFLTTYSNQDTVVAEGNRSREQNKDSGYSFAWLHPGDFHEVAGEINVITVVLVRWRLCFKGRRKSLNLNLTKLKKNLSYI